MIKEKQGKDTDAEHHTECAGVVRKRWGYKPFVLSMLQRSDWHLCKKKVLKWKTHKIVQNYVWKSNSGQHLVKITDQVNPK